MLSAEVQQSVEVEVTAAKRAQFRIPFLREQQEAIDAIKAAIKARDVGALRGESVPYFCPKHWQSIS